MQYNNFLFNIKHGNIIIIERKARSELLTMLGTSHHNFLRA